jgi:hypothetical protein
MRLSAVQERVAISSSSIEPSVSTGGDRLVAASPAWELTDWPFGRVEGALSAAE